MFKKRSKFTRRYFIEISLTVVELGLSQKVS